MHVSIGLPVKAGSKGIRWRLLTGAIYAQLVALSTRYTLEPSRRKGSAAVQGYEAICSAQTWHGVYRAKGAAIS